jgi:putative ATP-binding cassette transporter
MSTVRLLLRAAPGMVALTAGIALLSGALNAGLIAAAHHALSGPPGADGGLGGLAAGLVWVFVLLGVGKLLTGFLSEVLLARYAQAAVARLRQDLVRRLLDVPLRRFEEIGAARVYAALTDDVLAIQNALGHLPGLAVNLAILAGGGAYLAWLSPPAFAVLLLLAGAGAFTYRALARGAFRHLEQARSAQDRLFAHFRALTEGVKELKLHRARRADYLARWIEPVTDRVARANVGAVARFVLAHSTSHAFFFLLVGLTLFLLPQVEGAGGSVAVEGYVLTSLYLMGPLGGALQILPALGRADVALRRVEGLGVSLAPERPAAAAAADPLPADWSVLRLRGVTHTYRREDDEQPFRLGPLDLDVRRGEVLFVTGGNGSGKSTLAKLLTGLYPPESGALWLDDVPITDARRDPYRQQVSAVFADFYLFEALLGLAAADLDERAERYLADLGLAHKVRVQDGVLSTTALSQGQRKRLALLTMILEDRPLFVFDEWASDQDPAFKELFYRHLVPDLRARGKTVVVITHDDRYFDAADRQVKLEDGRLVEPAAAPTSLDAAPASASASADEARAAVGA